MREAYKCFTTNILIFKTYYMAVSQKDWELTNLRIWLAEYDKWPWSRFSHLGWPASRTITVWGEKSCKLQYKKMTIFFGRCYVQKSRFMFNSSPFASKMPASFNRLLQWIIFLVSHITIHSHKKNKKIKTKNKRIRIFTTRVTLRYLLFKLLPWVSSLSNWISFAHLCSSAHDDSLFFSTSGHGCSKSG